MRFRSRFAWIPAFAGMTVLHEILTQAARPAPPRHIAGTRPAVVEIILGY